MTQRIAFIIENDKAFDLKELFKELNFNILQSTGLYFRTTNIDNDHLYAKCRYGNNLQKKDSLEHKLYLEKNFKR